MDTTDTVEQTKLQGFINRHSFLLFVLLAIIISSVIVWISMELYNISGAAQLDLSRPGYKSVRSQATKGENDLKSYSSNGPISQSEINNFKTLYSKQSKMVKEVDAFGGDPLSPDALVIGQTVTQSN